MFEKLLGKGTEDKSIGEISSSKARDLLKTLSGGEIKYTKKVVDNVIVVSGAAGGAGASTIAANMAYLASA